MVCSGLSENGGKLMNVKNCRKCRKLFNYVVGPFLCPNCKDELEMKFQEVKKYVQGNAGAGVHEVSEACDVGIPQIQQWVREERLMFTESAAIGLECERCGKSVRSGRYCIECRNELTNEFKGAMGQQTNSAGTKSNRAKMRYLDQE